MIPNKHSLLHHQTRLAKQRERIERRLLLARWLFVISTVFVALGFLYGGIRIHLL